MIRPLPALTPQSLGSQIPRRGHGVLVWLARLILRLIGWRIVGELPDVPRAVLVVAPHTSNFDGLVGISAIQALSLDVRFMAKDTLFTGRAGQLLRWLGGIPVDRSRADRIVEQTSAAMASKPFWLGLAPEGTRDRAQRWKTGFYRIAEGLQLPMVVIGFCYRRKQIRVVDSFVPSGDMDADLARIIDKLADIEPRRPERLSAPLRYRRLSDR
ncbi:acyltransferase [Alcanivorax hongdengensis A-11-3]|uniref:Acyltransferase n=1 Tax=Alcanivorax hongdengensis A-11-3 TaxID=1177179 RepID=L0WDH8_9GAMM|nr:1-acyl-sn-glycerol-3-phosphate acyltransferase [Alcanivorax hongdengensis]EKF75066.1 acyltransferase [Alcanivorax hongdengensis A-11-3]